jgi:molybdopterin-guanine dinucleotide biosynthesis protein A
MGTDKALLEFEGEPLVLRVAARVAGAADPVLLAPGAPGRLAVLGTLPYREVADARPGTGPLGGIVAALAASPHSLLAVVAVDMPFASPDLLALMADLYEGQDAVVPVSAHGPEPLHALYTRQALPVLRAALEEGSLAMGAALEHLRVRHVHRTEWGRADPSGRFAFNLNRAEDLAWLEP